MFSLYCVFVNLSRQPINVPADVVALLQHTYMGFAAVFFREEKPFPRYDWYTNAREKCQNMRKWV